MRLLIWNLHDWSGKRESGTRATPALLSTLLQNKADLVFLNEVKNLDHLREIVGGEYEISQTLRLTYASPGMLANPLWDLKKAQQQKDNPFTEYYALLVRKDLGVTCESVGPVSINPPREGSRVSPRHHATNEFVVDESTGTKHLVCRQYRPVWHWSVYGGEYKAIELLGVHTKPIGSKESESALSTMAQTCQAVRYAEDNFVSDFWVVCGDFYANPVNLKEHLGGDSVRCQIVAPAENTNHPGKGQGCVADYFVVGAELKVQGGARRIDIDALESTSDRYSDHDPVVIDLAWP